MAVMHSVRRRRRKPKKWLKTVLILVIGVTTLVAVIATAGALFVASVANTFDTGTTKIPNAFPEGPRPEAADNGAMNILLMGSDSRAEAGLVGGSTPTDQRSDSLMLVHLAADRKNVHVMSIMRDSWVDIPGHGYAKINAAFAYGGTQLTVQTVEALLGARIDHVALIDFEGFKGMTDALGGVDVISDKAFSSDSYTFTAGPNYLSGPRALEFVRERHAFADADYQRVRNQQAFMRALGDKLLSASTLSSPGTISTFIDKTAPYLSVDETLDFPTLAALGLTLRDVRSDTINYLVLPTTGGGVSADGQMYLSIDASALPLIKDALATDSLTAFIASRS